MAQNIFCDSSSPNIATTTTQDWRVWPSDCLYTIGYEGLAVPAFIDRLKSNDVSVLVDVRCNAISRKRGFSKNGLGSSLQEKGIIYRHIPQLGVPSEHRQNLGSAESYKNLFHFYDNEILPANLLYIAQVMELLTQYHRVALMCFEADFHTCHRHRISEYMHRDSVLGIEVKHL